MRVFFLALAIFSVFILYLEIKRSGWNGFYVFSVALLCAFLTSLQKAVGFKVEYLYLSVFIILLLFVLSYPAVAKLDKAKAVHCKGTAPILNQSKDAKTKVFEDGSSLEWVAKDTLRYTEGRSVLFIRVEQAPGFFSNGRVVWGRASLKKWSVNSKGDSGQIREDKRAEITSKLSEYFAIAKIPFRIID